MSTRRKVVLSVLAVALLVACATAYVILWHTSAFATALLTIGGSPPDLRGDPVVASTVEMRDDGYAVEKIDDQTFVIGAPRYRHRALSYLIVGRDRAVLFDTGPGLGDMDAVVRTLTDRPVIAAASHLHYDHVGGLDRFDAVALADHPELRALADADGGITPPPDLHLGGVEAIEPERFTVTAWWAHGQRIELGGRTLEVMHTPGHTKASMMLFDAQRAQLYSGDFLYPDELLALFPGAHMGDYLASAERLVERMPPNVVIMPGHLDTEAEPWAFETLAASDLSDLAAGLRAIRDDEADMVAVFPPKWRINDRIELIGVYRWNMAWDRR